MASESDDNTRKSSRRDFLKGKAASKAFQSVVDRGQQPQHDVDARRPAVLRPPSYLMQVSRRAMATDFQIYLNADQPSTDTEAALAALDLVEVLEDQMTVYREHSQVMDINRRAAHEPVVVEPRLYTIIAQAVQLHQASHGAYDFTAGPLSKTWGFSRRQGRFPTAEEIQSALQNVGTQWIHLDDETRSIRFLREGVEINLNAIGKGYALDRCRELLEQEDVNNFLIHGGMSSVLACGTRSGLPNGESGWKTALRHPLKPDRRLVEIRLRSQAMGTSGSGTQFFHHHGRRYGHVLDPRTGWPADGVLSATVIAPTAAEADALATAFYVMGREAVEVYCETRPELAALLVCPGQRAGSIEMSKINWDLAEATPGTSNPPPATDDRNATPKP